MNNPLKRCRFCDHYDNTTIEKEWHNYLIFSISSKTTDDKYSRKTNKYFKHLGLLGFFIELEESTFDIKNNRRQPNQNMWEDD